MSSNRYGLDEDYFKRKLARIIEDLSDYTPQEAACTLLRYALVADTDAVIDEVNSIQARQRGTS